MVCNMGTWCASDLHQGSGHSNPLELTAFTLTSFLKSVDNTQTWHAHSLFDTLSIWVSLSGKKGLALRLALIHASLMPSGKRRHFVCLCNKNNISIIRPRIWDSGSLRKVCALCSKASRLHHVGCKKNINDWDQMLQDEIRQTWKVEATGLGYDKA